MTNQEIFDDLGEMGTLMMLFLEMAAADGEFTDAELATVFEAASNFTDHDVEQFVQNALRVAKTLSFEERVGSHLDGFVESEIRDYLICKVFKAN